MELKVTDITYELDNEDGLSYLLFKYAGGCFSIGRMEEDENIYNIYLEKDDQSNGQYFDPDCFEYFYENGEIELSIDLDSKRILQYLKENNLSADLYGNTVLIFDPVNPEKFKEMSNVISRIFNHWTCKPMNELK